jgi:Ca2+-binding EF-hand superfamily protein
MAPIVGWAVAVGQQGLARRTLTTMARRCARTHSTSVGSRQRRNSFPSNIACATAASLDGVRPDRYQSPPTIHPRESFVSYPSLIAAVLIAGAVPAIAAPSLPSARPVTAKPAPAAAPKPLTRAQFTRRLTSGYKALDANSDGVVDKAELESTQARVAAQTQAEINKRLEAEFARLDTNKDGQISLAELKAGSPLPKAAGTDQILQKLDTDQDGKVEEAEYRAAPLANFDRLDADRDGTISIDEQRAGRTVRRR